jgi:hypothetical protein
MTEKGTICRRCSSPVETEDLRCPICSHATPATETIDEGVAAVEVLRCTGCGAAVTYNVSAQAPECAFCGSVTELEVPGDPLEQTERYLPFTVDRRRAEGAFRGWLGSLGWFRPSDLVAASTIESIRPLWWVGWVFDAGALVSWTVDSDLGAQRADWAPHAGQTELDFDDVVVSASRGLSDEETAFLTPAYDLRTARDEIDAEMSDAVIERFEVQRSSAREVVAKIIRQITRRRLQEGHLPGRKFRNLNSAVLLSRLVTRRYAFPSWVLAYRYRNTLYRTVLCGQAERRIHGTAPYSAAKVLLAVAGAVLGLGLLLAGFAAILS